MRPNMSHTVLWGGFLNVFRDASHVEEIKVGLREGGLGRNDRFPELCSILSEHVKV